MVRQTNIGAVLIALALIGISAVGSKADIPPPQHFVPSKTTPAYSEWVEVAGGDDANWKGQQEHPFGSLFETEGYCQVSLVIYAGPGARAILNVMGSSDRDAATGGGSWVQEIAPVSFTGSPGWNGIFFGAVLRHKLVQFFLSTPDKPGVPDMGTSIGGAVIVQAQGITPGVERARWLLHSPAIGWESPKYCPTPEPWKN
ncbi:MAG TPA: hypothetical protein VFE16_05435 [Candidatus Cybelea sp.]|jgi:hypothetical protein|nr:hypothetical protein [Candidatus Cybelea sp.]